MLVARISNLYYYIANHEIVLSSNSFQRLRRDSLLFILVLGIAVPINVANANHLSEDTNWQLVMLSNHSACSNYHYQTMNKFDSLTQQYFELYNFSNDKYNPMCITLSDYQSEYTKPENLDLIILVLDRNLGEKHLHELKMGGPHTFR